jgi:soluble lytic murein transglycosylase
VVKSPKLPRRAVPLTLFLALPLLLGSATSEPARRAGAPGPIPGHSDRAALAYAEAADSLRRQDCAGAQRALQPLAAGQGSEAELARLVTGLYAHACEDVATAEERLFAAANPGGPLEDWRLFILSDAAAARGHQLLSHASLAKLLGDHPGSPLRSRALVKAASAYWAQGSAARALEVIEQARREGVSGEEASRLEGVAWEIGGRFGDGEVRRQAARRLLTEAPFKAAELNVVELFRQRDGSVHWAGVLTPGQLVRRAESLLKLDMADSAIQTLSSVPRPERDLGWHLLQARALTAAGRGHDALEALAPLGPEVPAQAAALEWARAQAAAEAATARRGPRNLPAEERRRLRAVSQKHLRRVVQLDADRELSAKALRSLFASYREEGLFDLAMETLRSLRRVDPGDTSGAAHLWNSGWSEFAKGNYSGSIGYWTELYALYPETQDGRRGRYWTARAFELLGEAERSRQIYREVAASDTTDLYRKNALARLGPAGRPAEATISAPVRPEPWPDSPPLRRARLLTDLGLDDLAVAEKDLVGAEAPVRSLRALESLILARRGERRKSITVIRDAFPALGGPHQANLPEQARLLYYPLDYQEPIRAWAARNRLPTSLVLGMIRQESAFDLTASSWAGARGLMQLMPATARELAQKAGLPYSHDRLSEPEFNVRLGTTYFRQVLEMFDGNVELALAGYNGGPYRIKRLWREWGSSDIDRFLEELKIEESRIYVKRILVLSDSYRQLYPEAAG